MNTLPRHSNTWYRSVLCIIITLPNNNNNNNNIFTAIWLLPGSKWLFYMQTKHEIGTKQTVNLMCG